MWHCIPIALPLGVVSQYTGSLMSRPRALSADMLAARGGGRAGGKDVFGQDSDCLDGEKSAMGLDGAVGI